MCEVITLSEPANGEKGLFASSFKSMDQCKWQPVEILEPVAQGPVFLVSPSLPVPAHVPLAKGCKETQARTWQ